MLKLLILILEAIPVLDKWFQELQKEYTKKKIEDGNHDYAEALSLAIKSHDTTKLKAAIGKHLDP